MGANDACSDAQIWTLRCAILNNTAGSPGRCTLPADDKLYPYFIVADDAFALKDWMMKPFGQHTLTEPECIFNYLLYKARRVVENAFGIMCSRFRCLVIIMGQNHETVYNIVMAVVCLHNISTKRYPTFHIHLLDREDRHHTIIHGAWPRVCAMEDIPEVRVGSHESVAENRLRDWN